MSSEEISSVSTACARVVPLQWTPIKAHATLGNQAEHQCDTLNVLGENSLKKTLKFTKECMAGRQPYIIFIWY